MIEGSTPPVKMAGEVKKRKEKKLTHVRTFFHLQCEITM